MISVTVSSQQKTAIVFQSFADFMYVQFFQLIRCSALPSTFWSSKSVFFLLQILLGCQEERKGDTSCSGVQQKLKKKINFIINFVFLSLSQLQSSPFALLWIVMFVAWFTRDSASGSFSFIFLCKSHVSTSKPQLRVYIV